MAFAPQLQSDWSAGIYRSRNAIPNALYDAVNVLVDDDGHLFRRGGSAYLSTVDAANAPNGIADALVAAGPRTIIWPGDPTAGFQVLSAGSPVSVFTGARITAFARATPIPSGLVALPFFSGASAIYYGGSLRTSDAGSFTGGVTNGSRTITSDGTSGNSFSTHTDAGSIVEVTSGGNRVGVGVIQTVVSASSATLREPFSGATTASATLSAIRTWTTAASGDSIIAVAYAGQRVLLMTKSRVYLGPLSDPFHDPNVATDYVEVQAEQLIGIQGMGSSALVFGSGGVTRIDNLELSLVDDFGNIQITQEKVNTSLTLWADSGIAAYGDSIVVPAIDDVYLMSASGSAEAIGAPFHGNGIGAIYRSYVKAGYRPGTATVHRSHYLLPIVNGTTWVDTLVCRLDRPYLLSSRPRIWGYPWTRWAGHAAATAYTQRIADSSRTPSLYGISGLRATDLTSCFDPSSSNSLDADGTTSNVTLITQDYATQDGVQKGTVRRARLNYVLQSDGTHTNPTLALAVSSDEDADVYSAPTASGLQGGGTAGATSDGTKYSFWNMAKRRARIRYKITVSGASASFVLRSLESLIRPTGKR